MTYKVNVTTQSALSNNATYAAQATDDYLVNQTGPLTLGGASVAGTCLCPQLKRADSKTRI